ncbi:MAG: HDOD domain-containing protein [Burkholderiaceae bacterium]
MPALSLAPARLASLAANSQVRENELARVALSDPALALRLLRVANGSTYSSRDRSEVVTVSRAIALLGHDQIASHARQVRPAPAKAQVQARRQLLVREELAAAALPAISPICCSRPAIRWSRTRAR